MGARLVQFKVKSFPKMRVIGKGISLEDGNVSPEDQSIEGLWESMAHDGSLDVLAGLPGRMGSQRDLVGWMGDFHPPAMHFTYLAGALFEPDVAAPEGLICRDIQPGEMAVSTIQGMEGPEGGDMHIDGSAINNRAMASHGYEYDGSHGLYEMEYQSYEFFYLPLECGQQPALDFYSPCKHQGSQPVPGK